MSDLTREQHAKRVLGHLEDMLGGEGWDHPRLLMIVVDWVDPTVSPATDAENLVNVDSFDPRDLIKETCR